MLLSEIAEAVGGRRIRVRPYPEGRGAGEAFVRQHFPAEAAEQRRRATRMKCGLLTAIDADTRTVDERYDELLGQLDRPRGADEKIAVFVPKRNIETWVAYLRDGGPLDETKPYPKLDKGRLRECYPAVDRLLEITREGIPDDCPDSLRRAVTDEMPRLP